MQAVDFTAGRSFGEAQLLYSTAMPASQRISVDWREERSPLQVLPNPPELTSSRLNWRAAQMQLHSQPAWECPEHTFQQHVVSLHHYPQPARSERVFAGQRQSEILTEGNVVIMPAGIPHWNRWNKPGRFAVAIFEVQRLAEIDPDSTDPARLELRPQFATWDSLIQQIMRALEHEVRLGESGTSLYADSLATALAAHLLTRYSSRRRPLPETHPCALRARRAADFIQDNLDQDLTLSAIASTVHLSDYHFARMFRRTMGVAPHQFLIRCRIERAQHLLRTTDLALEEIAYRVGFSSASQLAVHFRRLLGTSPAWFRAAVE